MPKRLNYAKRIDQGREWLQNMESEFRRDAEAALARWLAGKRVIEAVDDEEDDAELMDPVLRDGVEALEQLENLAHWRGAKAAMALADGDREEGWELARRFWREIALVAMVNARAFTEEVGPASFFFRMAIADKALLGLLAVGEAKTAHWLSEHMLHSRGQMFRPSLGQTLTCTVAGAFASCLERASRGDWAGVSAIRAAGADLGPYAALLDAWNDPDAFHAALVPALDWHVQQTLAEREFDEGF